MTAKAARLRAKRQLQKVGRPRKEDADRHPCGKIKSTWIEKEARQVVIDARKRIHGVTEKQAGSLLSGSVLGLLFLDGKITEVEMKAGVEYGEKMARYYALSGFPFPSPRAQELFRIGGQEGDESESKREAVEKASNRMMGMEGVLLRLHDGPQVKTTVRNVCLMDFEVLRTMPARQLAWLRSGLQALAMHFGVAAARQIG